MPRIIANAINNVARQTIGKDWLLYAALLDHWAEIVGKEYAELTTPVKITFPHQPNEPKRQAGTLVIKLPKGLTMEFSFKSELIRQRINSYFGYEAIARLVLDPMVSNVVKKGFSPPAVTAEAQRKTAEVVKAVPSGELHDALQSLGQILYSKNDIKKS